MEVSLYEREVEIEQRRKEALRDARNWRLGRAAQAARDGQLRWSVMGWSWLVERVQVASRAARAGLVETQKPEEQCC